MVRYGKKKNKRKKGSSSGDESNTAKQLRVGGPAKGDCGASDSEEINVSDILSKTSSVLFGSLFEENPVFVEPVCEDNKKESAAETMAANVVSQGSSDVIVGYLKKIDAKLEKVDKKLEQFDRLEQKVCNFEAEIKRLWLHVEKTAGTINDKLTSLGDRVDNSEWLTGHQESKIHHLEQENGRLRDSVTYLQSQSMRSNLVFSNIPERENERPEDTEKVLREFMVEKLKLAQEYVESIKIDRAHRIGAYSRDQNRRIRNIVCKFNLFKDREAVKQKRTELRGSNQFVSEQFPPEIVAKRKRLLPHLKKAKSERKNAWIAYDTLYVDGKAVRFD